MSARWGRGNADPAGAGVSALALSVVVPVHDEDENIATLIEEIVAALRGRIAFEVVFVDDASTDATLQTLRNALDYYPELRVLRHLARAGQSAAIHSGVRAAKGAWIATLDGDGQSDPADLPKLIAARDAGSSDTRLYAGWRRDRRDRRSWRWAAKFADALRARLLRDARPDPGCGTKLFERGAFLDLPEFEHMHRFLPALMQRAGWKTASVPVSHRPRAAGESKYDNLSRAWVGIGDLFGLMWLQRRTSRAAVEEVRRR